MSITLQWWHLVPALWTAVFTAVYLYFLITKSVAQKPTPSDFLVGWLITGGMATLTGLLAQYVGVAP